MSEVKSNKVLLLFAKKSVSEGKTHPKELINLINDADEGMMAYAATFEELLFFIDEQKVEIVDTANKRSFREYDAVYFRYWGDAQGPAMAAAKFCHMAGIPFVDSEVYRKGSYNKITQYMNLHEAGVPFPRTLVGNHDSLLDNYLHYGFSFPLVIKSAGGTRGQDNYVVHNEAELRDILLANPTLIFVMQTFIPNEGDYRVLVMGDTVPMVIKRMAKEGTHLNNVSQGGEATVVPANSLPKEVLEMSIKAAAFFGRQIAGVDMVQSLADGRYYCFEVNRSPQIDHASFESEKATYLARYLRSLVKS